MSLLTGAYGPAAFRGAYGVSGTTSTTRTVAIVDAYDDSTALSDLNTYSTHFGIPTMSQCAVSGGTAASPCFQKVNESGGASSPPSDGQGVNGWAGEISLDVQIVHAMCQNCNILLIEATSASDNDLITAADGRAYLMGANVVSNSWGGSEDSSETSEDSAFNHPGVPYVFSTGDDGYGVQYPAASPNVTAVGGTSLLVNTDYTYNSETAWSGAGSGCSSYEPKPSFQHDTDCSKRTVADVSADADPNTGALIYYNGSTYQFGGTSLAAPLIASIYALAGGVGTTLGNSLPYANLNYGVNLRDVTSGSNGPCAGSYLCTSKTGYDGPTGLGSPLGSTAFSIIQPVSVVSVFTTDANGTAAALGNTPQAIIRNSQTVRPFAVKTVFNPGDPIELFIETNNQNSITETASFQWIVLDPEGHDVPALEYSGDLDTDPGTWDWELTSSIPAASPSGNYTFTGKITFNGVTTSATTNFFVDGSYQAYLPLVFQNFAFITNIVNGDFESGSTGWTEYSKLGYAIILSSTTTSLPITPHSGTYLAWLGGDNNEISYIQQQVTISSGAPYLVYWEWIDTVDICGYDYSYVLINASTVDTSDLCASTNTGAWVTHTVNLSAYAGQSVTLQINVTTDASDISDFYVDDVSLQATAPAAAQNDSPLPNPSVLPPQGKRGIVVPKTAP